MTTFEREPDDGDNDFCEVVATYGNDEHEKEVVMCSGRRIDMEEWVSERRVDYPREQAWFDIMLIERRDP